MPKFPFKMNSWWLKEEYCFDMVVTCWSPYDPHSSILLGKMFAKKLKCIKLKMKEWALAKKQAELVEFRDIESKLHTFTYLDQ